MDPLQEALVLCAGALAETAAGHHCDLFCCCCSVHNLVKRNCK